MRHLCPQCQCHSFFFNDTATTEIYTLSLHDALPISKIALWGTARDLTFIEDLRRRFPTLGEVEKQRNWKFRQGGIIGSSDRKSTRLNSSHANISYAVFCLKKKLMCMYSTRLSLAGFA